MSGYSSEDAQTLAGYKHLGIRLSEYSFACPCGIWRARLIAKAWGKKRNILLYFSEVETEQKYCISLFFFSTHYRTEDGGFDFRTQGKQDDVFELETALGHTGRTRLLSARTIPRHDDGSTQAEATLTPVS